MLHVGEGQLVTTYVGLVCCIYKLPQVSDFEFNLCLILQVKFCRVQSYQLNDHLSPDFVSVLQTSLLGTQTVSRYTYTAQAWPGYVCPGHGATRHTQLLWVPISPKQLSAVCIVCSAHVALYTYNLISHLQLQTALPAILVYQGGLLVGNLLRIAVRDDFTEEDVEQYLQE